MATASVKTSHVVTLSLTAEEALFLRRLMGHHIVGPDNGPRVHSTSIWDALVKFDSVLWLKEEAGPFDVARDSPRLFLHVEAGRDCRTPTQTHEATAIDNIRCSIMEDCVS